MLNISRSSPGEYIIDYFGNKWVFYVYLCRKKEDSLNTEISSIENIVKGVYSLIPSSAIRSFFNIIQGTLHFLIHEKRFLKARNRGLLLSMLIIGKNQLKETIDELEKQFNKSDYYYLVVTNTLEKPSIVKCTPIDYECLINEIDADILKNIYVLLNKL